MPSLIRKPILAAQAWRTNAELVAAAAKLFFPPNPSVMDATYGDGLWWTVCRPKNLVAHDLFKGDGVDVRCLPEADNHYTVVAFDPPYVSIGGRGTSTLDDFNEAYGTLTAPTSPADLQHGLIEPGMKECARVLQPGGLLLVKCMPYVSSGHTYPGNHYTFNFATEVIGLQYVDEFVHVGHARAQPLRTYTDGAGRVRRSKQHHPRHNASTLFVFRKRRPRRQRS